MTANGGRWQATMAMPSPNEMRYEHSQVYVVLQPGSRYFTWDEAVDRGWLEPVPWPGPDQIGAFI